MNVNLGIWDKLSKLVLVLLFFAGVFCVFFWYLPLIQKNQRYRKEILALDVRVVEQEKAGRQLRASIDLLQNDPRVVERLARERLSWENCPAILPYASTRTFSSGCPSELIGLRVLAVGWTMSLLGIARVPRPPHSNSSSTR